MAGVADTLGLEFIPGRTIPSGLETEIGGPASQEMPQLHIQDEFRSLIPPLDPGAREDLKNSLQKEGCRDKLVICRLDGQYVLLDGHNRYEICRELGVPFETTEISVSSRTEAKIWIIKNQRSRRNLDESQRAMLAVKLEALYAEEAKNRQGMRTDLGQKLDKGEAGRSAEKAAKDMGVSHQTVSYAKNVTKKGIPELAKIVESGDVAVSIAAKVASKQPDIQREVVDRAEAQIREGNKPKVASILRDMELSARDDPDEDPDKRLEKLRKKQEDDLELLQSIAAVQRPENLVEILQVAERIVAKLREIETQCLDPTISQTSNCVIEIDHFKTFLMSLAPVSKALRVSFEADGVHAVASDTVGYMVAEAFLPKELFAKYVELGEIGLPDTQKLFGMVSRLAADSTPGKRNLRLFIEPLDEGDYSGKLHGISGQKSIKYRLWRPEIILEGSIPEISSTCEVVVEGKELATALKNAKNIDQIGKFLVSNGTLQIVSINDDAQGTQRPSCRVLRDGFADPRFDIKRLTAIKRIIEKSKGVTLGLGTGEPMVMDMSIGQIAIKYRIREVGQSV